MNITILAVGITVIGLVRGTAPVLAQESGHTVTKADSQMSSEAFVLDMSMRANRILGVQNHMKGTEQDKTPLDTDRIDSAQYVEIDSGAVPHTGCVRLMTVSAVDVASETESRPRSFKVYIDSTTNRLLKIESALPSYYAKIKEGRMRERPIAAPGGTALPFGPWEYVGLPDKDPGVSLLEALKAVFGDVAAADRIQARYLLVHHPLFGTQPAWVIETWISWTIVPSGGGKVEEHQASYRRSIIDDRGNRLVSGN